MVAGESSCRCSTCGAVCEGRFAGCPAVWAAGPREVSLVEPDAQSGASPAPVVSAFLSAERPERSHLAGAPSAPEAGDARAQVFDWLQDSFEGLRSQLKVLSDAVGRQQQALGSMSEAGATAERLAELADALPDRIGEAVQGAMVSLPPVPESAPGDGSGPSINRGGWQDRLRALRPQAREGGAGEATGTR